MSIMPVMIYKLQSSAKPLELEAILKEHIEPFPIVVRFRDHKMFAGTVTESGFRIVRIGHNRNSFRPTLFGVFLPSDNRTIIRVTVKHSASFFVGTIIFSLLFFSIGLYVTALPILSAILRSDIHMIMEYLPPLFLFSLFAPIAVMLLSYILARLSFSSETKASRNELKVILAHVIEPESG